MIPMKHEVHYINKLKKAFNAIDGIKAIYTDPLTDSDGIPDLLILNDQYREYCYVEVKKMQEPLRPNQVVWAKKHIKDGIMYIFRVQECGKKWIIEQYDTQTEEVLHPLPNPISIGRIVKEVV
jgi:hypothetical protein